MKLTFRLAGDILEVDFSGRETAEETRAMIEQMFAEREKHGVLAILIRGKDSRPIFKVDGYDLQGALARIAAIPGLRVAGVTVDRDLRASHEYVTLLASQRKVPMRLFDSDEAAREWLREPRGAAD